MAKKTTTKKKGFALLTKADRTKIARKAGLASVAAKKKKKAAEKRKTTVASKKKTTKKAK